MAGYATINKEELTTLRAPQGTSHCSCHEHCFLFGYRRRLFATASFPATNIHQKKKQKTFSFPSELRCFSTWCRDNLGLSTWNVALVLLCQVRLAWYVLFLSWIEYYFRSINVATNFILVTGWDGCVVCRLFGLFGLL